MNALRADLRFGVRLLWRDKAFTVTAGLTLAVCIGANVALFSVIRGVLLRPLAMPAADRVVIAGNVYPGRVFTTRSVRRLPTTSESQLFGVTATNPAVLIIVSAVLARRRADRVRGASPPCHKDRSADCIDGIAKRLTLTVYGNGDTLAVT